MALIILILTGTDIVSSSSYLPFTTETRKLSRPIGFTISSFSVSAAINCTYDVNDSEARAKSFIGAS